MSELAHLVKAMREAQKERATLPTSAKQAIKRAKTMAVDKAQEAVREWLMQWLNESESDNETEKQLANLTIEAIRKKTRKLPTQNEFDQIDKILESIEFTNQQNLF